MGEAPGDPFGATSTPYPNYEFDSNPGLAEWVIREQDVHQVLLAWLDTALGAMRQAGFKPAAGVRDFLHQGLPHGSRLSIGQPYHDSASGRTLDVSVDLFVHARHGWLGICEGTAVVIDVTSPDDPTPLIYIPVLRREEPQADDPPAAALEDMRQAVLETVCHACENNLLDGLHLLGPHLLRRLEALLTP